MDQGSAQSPDRLRFFVRTDQFTRLGEGWQIATPYTPPYMICPVSIIQ